MAGEGVQQAFQAQFQEMYRHLIEVIGHPAFFLQLGAVVALLLLAFLLRGLLSRGLISIFHGISAHDPEQVTEINRVIRDIAGLLLATVFLWAAYFLTEHYRWGNQVIRLSRNILSVWVAIRVMSGFIVGVAWSRLFALLVGSIAALDILGILDPFAAALNSIGIDLDNERISLLVIIKAVIMLTLVLPLISWLTRLIQQKIQQSAEISPRVQILLVKLLRTALFTLAILIALDSVGFDFHLLAVFGGALGLGLGFGLQRVVSNLTSGVIILADNSIRPGDVIEVGGVFGWIESLHSRFISVVTRDGTSYLIPNDELISSKVINWSFSGPGVRLKIPVGISYNSDVHQAMALMVAATGESPRILANPKPAARLVSFGESSINLDLRIWIKDPEKGVTNVKSSVQLKIWDLFKANGIEFPFPQHDLHLKSPAELTVRLKERLD